MTTRELIEAVHRVESFMGSPSVNGVRIPTACVRSTDYDALRAATLAVLDAMLDAPTMQDYEEACDNARALREKLK